MIGLHSQSGPAEVYNKSSQIQSQKYKGVILPPWDYIVFSNVNDNSSKICVTFGVYRFCALILMVVRLCVLLMDVSL